MELIFWQVTLTLVAVCFGYLLGWKFRPNPQYQSDEQDNHQKRNDTHQYTYTYPVDPPLRTRSGRKLSLHDWKKLEERLSLIQLYKIENLYPFYVDHYLCYFSTMWMQNVLFCHDLKKKRFCIFNLNPVFNSDSERMSMWTLALRTNVTCHHPTWAPRERGARHRKQVQPFHDYICMTLDQILDLTKELEHESARVVKEASRGTSKNPQDFQENKECKITKETTKSNPSVQLPLPPLPPLVHSAVLAPVPAAAAMPMPMPIAMPGVNIKIIDPQVSTNNQ